MNKINAIGAALAVFFLASVTLYAKAGAQNQAPPNQGQDPAAVNVAPSGPSYTTEAPPAPSQASPEQAIETATEPPPPLPDYAQPPPPADGYI